MAGGGSGDGSSAAVPAPVPGLAAEAAGVASAAGRALRSLLPPLFSLHAGHSGKFCRCTLE